MAEVLAEYAASIEGGNGVLYIARAVGAEADDGLWQGWIEFIPLMPGRHGAAVAARDDAAEPQDVEYWATGLTPVYLEGALRRALNPLKVRHPQPKPEPVYDEPAPDFVERRRRVRARAS